MDFSVVNSALKLKWLNSCILHKDSLLRCDCDAYKLPVKLSDFHQQVLLYWNLIYKPWTETLDFILFVQRGKFAFAGCTELMEGHCISHITHGANKTTHSM